jgi:hypothetical protein
VELVVVVLGATVPMVVLAPSTLVAVAVVPRVTRIAAAETAARVLSLSATSPQTH